MTLNTKDIYDKVTQLFAKSKKEPYVVGNGIITTVKIGFSKEKLDLAKQEIAQLLQQIGIDEFPLISLGTLTKNKSGETWNKLDTVEDFQALELLLASSNACGFIRNDEMTKQLNINEVGDISSIAISENGRNLFGDKQWLEFMKEFIIQKMFFFVDMEAIKNATLDVKKVEENQNQNKTKVKVKIIPDYFVGHKK